MKLFSIIESFVVFHQTMIKLEEQNSVAKAHIYKDPSRQCILEKTYFYKNVIAQNNNIFKSVSS